MQVDGVHALPAGDDDIDSLFGSPPPSPARGRSPQLALPTGPGHTENVGTIALPGSQYCSELAIDPAVLLLNRPLPQRNQDTPTPTPTSTHLTPPSSLSLPHRPTASRRPSRAPRNSKNDRDQSATPRPTPPINFPNPDEPLPSNFLRSQQALLGHAGLISGLDPSTLSTKYHKGTTSQNPIIVEDELDPPPLGKGDAYSFDSSLLPSPPSEEVVSSLVKQKNIFPVLESLLRLLSGTGVSNIPPAVSPFCSPSSFNALSKERGATPKRRRLNSVPAGAVDWDVPYPFEQGEGPTNYHLRWEKERLKQLLSQLGVLINGAKRSAAARTYLQQHADLWSSINTSMPEGQAADQQQPTPGASPLCEQQNIPAYPSYIENVASSPTVSEAPRQRSQILAAATQTASFDELVTSLLDNSIPRGLSSNITPFSSSSDSLLHHSSHIGSHVTMTPASSRASSAAPRQISATSATTPTAQIVPLSDQRRQTPPTIKALNKQEVIRRAKDRRQQLMVELERAKVELWETTIEQGVLNHLMKDHGCL